MKPIISPNCRIRHPDEFKVGDYSVVDDFSYFSTRVLLGRFCHIASGCTVAGGRARLFTLGSFSSISAGARIWLTSDDFTNDVVTIIHEGFPDVKDHVISGDVSIGRCTAVGSNAVVMPCNSIPEGVSIGALSYVPPNYSFEPWTVYAGIPIRPVKARNRENVLRQVRALEEAIGDKRN